MEEESGTDEDLKKAIQMSKEEQLRGNKTESAVKDLKDLFKELDEATIREVLAAKNNNLEEAVTALEEMVK